MRKLMTGGAGFIGSNLVGLLRKVGHEVEVLDSLMSGNRKNLDFDPASRFVEGDIRDPDAVAQAVELDMCDPEMLTNMLGF